MARGVSDLGTILAIGVVSAWFAASEAPAQQLPPADLPALEASDPSDLYFQGWMLIRDAEQLQQDDQPIEALAKFRRAAQIFDSVASGFPKWRPEMVTSRRKKTFDQIAEVSPAALRKREEEERTIAELEGGARAGAGPDGAQPPSLEVELPELPVQPARPVETLESRRIAELEKRVATLRDEITRSHQAERRSQTAAREQQAAANQARTQADRALAAAARARAEQERLAERNRQLEAEAQDRDVPPPAPAQPSADGRTGRDRDLAIARLQKAQAELDRLRRKLAEAPVQEEMDALARRINGLEREKEVMSRALESSQAESREARAQIDALQQERGRLRQEIADLRNNLEIERKTANEVVAGQRKQLEEFQQLVKAKDAELAGAKRRIQSLETELAEVRDSFNELREERDGLLRERDQMAALLKLNEAGQLQQVIDQNLALDRELRETRKQFERLQEDNDATKDELLEAKRDLAISKLRIQEFRREKKEQEQRLAELRERLRSEERALAEGDADPAEAEMLRRIIHRQLKVQEKREEARELLLSTLESKAQDDDEIRRAMAIFQGAELNLSPEEMRVLEAEEVDGVIVSPYARPRGEVERNLAGLERQLEPFRAAGTRAFQNGRLHAAREAFEMIVERHPGDTASMCRLGLVHYKLDDPIAAAEMFRRACEIDSRNPYAHRMLGHTLSKLGEHDEALRSLERAVELAPTQSENHLLLGNAQFRVGNLPAAEEAFRTASACDETLAEPHYNLAILCARDGRKQEGRDHYARALELGAAPNLDLEQRLQNEG